MTDPVISSNRGQDAATSSRAPCWRPGYVSDICQTACPDIEADLLVQNAGEVEVVASAYWERPHVKVREVAPGRAGETSAPYEQ